MEEYVVEITMQFTTNMYRVVMHGSCDGGFFRMVKT